MVKQLKHFFTCCGLAVPMLPLRTAMAFLLLPLLAMPAQGMESARNLVNSKESSNETSDQAKNDTATVVVLETSMGNIEIALDAEKAPQTVANFLRYVDEGYYDKTIFHRVIDGFMIQGGGFTADMLRKPTGAPVQNEANNGLLNVTGSIAMARTSAPHSATSQFFINVVDNQRLDHRGESAANWGYAVFGHVIQGMDVVNAIKAVETASSAGHGNVPVEPVLIKHAYRKDRGKGA